MENNLFLKRKAYNLRVASIKMTTAAGSGHATSCLSAADIVAALFFSAMQFDPQDQHNVNNDRFILSKGHASPLLYAAWKEVGLLTEQELLTYRDINSVLEGHPTPRFARAEAATGSLGIGLSIGAGMALSAKSDKLDFHTYVLLGDAEIAEGSNWEAAEIAAFYKLDNLVGIVDCNRLGQSTTALHEHDVQRYADKFAAFGWHTIVVDGHNMQDVVEALDAARANTGKPTMIIAKTFKGYGVQRVQDKQGFHGKAFKQENLEQILQELQTMFADAAAYDESSFAWQPTMPAKKNVHTCPEHITMSAPDYTVGDELATRKAFGHALAALGDACKTVVSLDGEVKNSTFAQTFEEKHAKRFFQCFVAEQNMVSMGVGLVGRGKIPFVSTFGTFFTRAHDQIRMAAIGRAPLRLVGSHVGVSIGQDGPSQMGLEDIAMMRALPKSVVLYPSDAVSTYALVEQMANYHDGISYLRTTRMATPIRYSNDEQFNVGGCKVIKQSSDDVACVVAAGVTLVEALKAYDELQKRGVSIAVIDLYSIKPMDTETVLAVAQKANKCVVTVEDHYLEGGLGQTVAYELRNSGIKVECLAVEVLPRSGQPSELLSLVGIDAQAIVKAVRKLDA